VGCSLGPLTDYITVMFRREDASVVDHSTLAHELGHACSLSHVDGGNNLMNPHPEPANRAQRRSLTRAQIALLRASRHVTYL
jgi:predicted Zn-dependent protease